MGYNGPMIDLLLVFFGGGCGAVCRYLSGLGYSRAFGLRYPFVSTLIVNVAGGLLMGLLVGWLVGYGVRGGSGSNRLRLLLGVGGLGGFTTFSSFSLEAVQLIERKAYGMSAGYILGSVVFSLLAVMLGLSMMRRTLT